MKVPARCELPESDCWDLTPLYRDENAWEDDFRKLDGVLLDFLRWKGHLGDSPDSLLQALKASDVLGRLVEKLYTYAHLKHDEDTADHKASARFGRIEAKNAAISGETAWFDPELMQIDEQKFAQFRNDPILAFYKRTLDQLEEERKHTLSEAEERILGLSSELFGAGERSFSLLNDADLEFPATKEENGRKKIPLTHGSYRKLMESRDRGTRRITFCNTHNTYGKFRNTFASMLETTVKANVLSAKLHHYPDAMTAALSGANIPIRVYTALIEAIHKHLPSYHKYFAYRAECMGMKKIEMYDISNTIVTAAPEKQYSWQEAVELVKNACKPLGDEYGKVLQRAFDERWIDIRECKGKRSGAYSSGCYDSNPYLLLNYDNTLDGVSTLAHELGHSLHSYFSHKTQDYHYASYPIFAAEIASTTNELLLHHYLMDHSDDPVFRASLLNNLLDTIRATMFRQTMFAEFEANIYARCEADQPLTADDLSDEYAKLNAMYHGKSVKQTPGIQYEWARIPHFHYDFYVYQYATGIAAAVAFSRDILAGKTEPYLNFLRAGDSRDVIDIIRDAGVDFSTSAPVDAAAALFDSTLEELKRCNHCIR